MHVRRDVAWLAVILIGAAVGGRLLMRQPAPMATAPASKAASSAQPAKPWMNWSVVFPAAFPRQHAADLALERAFTMGGVCIGMSQDEVRQRLGKPKDETRILTTVLWSYKHGFVQFDTSGKVQNVTGQPLQYHGKTLDSLASVTSALGQPDQVDKGGYGTVRVWRRGLVHVSVTTFKGTAIGGRPDICSITLTAAGI